ncbi:cytochrome c oxidase subunit 4 [Sinomonas terrae]|uniref:Cytochrome c oxidase polypeptide 4 n=1 Tax=Sinomonas terrae TaxID=2908838 RepID=A0ABS9TWM4_9MICC|nr:cytochrome c oxidase subunit 4 [Sinomonas terrae]MCH6468765.1 cytochrome c oxidase subunit 4 [Sinomonas terrae]
MKIESLLFGAIFVFLLIVGFIYALMTHFAEFAGGVPLALVAGLALMITTYLWVTGRRVGPRPEDRQDAEIHEGAGDQGFFSPWSWWPISLGAACAISVLGVAIAFWLVPIGAAFAIIGLLGWVFEYSRGDHSH